MPFQYHFTLPPSGPADALVVREMFDDVQAFVNTLVPGGTVVTSLNAGAGIGLSATTGDITITNTGVTSISTLNVNSNFSSATGDVVFSFSAAPTFQSVDLSVGTGAMIIAPALGTFTSWHMRFPPNPGTGGYLLSTDGNDPANTSWVAPTAVKGITGTTNQISVDNSGDPIVLSTPQDIATSSSPTFSEMLLSGGTSAADLTLKLHDSHNGFYADGSSILEVVLNSTIAAQWDFTTYKFWNTGPIQSKSFIFYDTAGSHPTVTINPPTGFTSYTLTLPVDDGTPNQYLTTNGSGVLSWTNAAGTGTVNSGTQYQLGYYATSTNAISGLTLITAGHVLVSDSNGLPVAATPTTTEINYVAGVTSLIQTQFAGKEPTLTKGNLTETTSSVLTITGGTGAIIGSGVTIAVTSAASGTPGVVTAGTQTLTGIKTFETQLIGKGVASTGDAAAGYIGEVMVASRARSSATGLTSPTAKDVASLTLTAGDWDVWFIGAVLIASGTPNATDLDVALSTTSATLPGTGVFGVQDSTGQLQMTAGNMFSTSSAGDEMLMGISRVPIGSSTTYYLVVRSIYGSGSVSAYGQIYARRRR